jgi:hypothetical protein
MQVGFRLEMHSRNFHLGTLVRDVGSVVKNEITLLAIPEVQVELSAQLVLGTIPAWAVDYSLQLDFRFPKVLARSWGARVAVEAGRPECCFSCSSRCCCALW